MDSGRQPRRLQDAVLLVLGDVDLDDRREGRLPDRPGDPGHPLPGVGQHEDVLRPDPLLLDQPPQPLDQEPPSPHGHPGRSSAAAGHARPARRTGPRSGPPCPRSAPSPPVWRCRRSPWSARPPCPRRVAVEDVERCLDDRPGVAEALRHDARPPADDVQPSDFQLRPSPPEEVLGVIVEDVEVRLAVAGRPAEALEQPEVVLQEVLALIDVDGVVGDASSRSG